jgi:predicted  nucleic acid-binding Zn-ribbon protein
MSVTEAVIEAIKDLVLPELNALKGAVSIIAVRIEVIEKRLDDFNGRFQAIDNHLLDQSRRVDELRSELSVRIDDVRNDLGARIDALRGEMTARIDQQTARIDELRGELTARIDQQTARPTG